MPNEQDPRQFIPLRESLADKIVRQHLAVKGAYTGPWLPSVHFDFAAVETQGIQTANVQADVSEGFIYAFDGISVRPTAGDYEGRFAETDSMGILDQQLTAAPGTTYTQFDGRLHIQDPNKRTITDEEGIPSPLLHRLVCPKYLQDPFYFEYNQVMVCKMEILRNPGIAIRVTLNFRGTILYGGEAAAR